VRHGNLRDDGHHGIEVTGDLKNSEISGGTEF
jgi:hypothetical protein